MHIIETRAAPNPRRVRMFLAEKGIQIAFEERDMMTGALQTSEFLRLNPYGRVPLLVLDDGTILAETVAICRYFEELQPDPPLFGTGALGRATVEMWNRRAELGLLQSIANVFRHLHPKMAPYEVPQVADWGEANKPKVLENLALIDERLLDSRYLAGDTFSIADITAFVAIGFMKPAKLAVPDTMAGIARWSADIAARPSATA